MKYARLQKREGGWGVILFSPGIPLKFLLRGAGVVFVGGRGYRGCHHPFPPRKILKCYVTPIFVATLYPVKSTEKIVTFDGWLLDELVVLENTLQMDQRNVLKY